MSVSSLSTTGFTATWGAATDDKTAQSSLQYKVVTSTSNNICDGSVYCTGSSINAQDWVIGANVVLCTSDYASKIGTANAFGYPTVTAGVLTTSASAYITGMTVAFGPPGSTANNCNNFGSTSGSYNYGLANQSGQDFFANNANGVCSSATSILCVEQ